MREAQARCSPREFLEWRVYFGRLTMWPEERADFRAGIVAYWTYLCWAVQVKNPPEKEFADFLAVRPPKPEQSAQDMMRMLGPVHDVLKDRDDGA